MLEAALIWLRLRIWLWQFFLLHKMKDIAAGFVFGFLLGLGLGLLALKASDFATFVIDKLLIAFRGEH